MHIVKNNHILNSHQGSYSWFVSHLIYLVELTSRFKQTSEPMEANIGVYHGSTYLVIKSLIHQLKFTIMSSKSFNFAIPY